jgi:hypothetical protein
MARGIEDDRSSQCLDDSRDRRLRKAQVERKRGIVVVPAPPQRVGELRAAGHS